MLKVLIVEDDADIAALHSHFVAQDGHYKVLGVAKTLAQARMSIQVVVPDLLVVDNYLPDGLGVELVHEMLALPQKPACILVTAANDAETVHKAHRFGAFDYLVKPVDYSRLANSLLRFIEYRSQLMESKAFRQREVDQLFRAQPCKLTNSIDEFTLAKIIAHFTHTHVEHTAESIAQNFAISKSTARRYLDSAVESGDLTAFLAHGKVGRPSRIYRRPTLLEIRKTAKTKRD